MNWLITGGCGFIGQGLVARLLQHEDNHIRVLDNLSTSYVEDLTDSSAPVAPQSLSHGDDWGARLALAVGDITDRPAVRQAARGADCIVHLAANTGVALAVADPWKDCRINVEGTLNLLEAARHEGVRRFVFASSGAPLGAQTPPVHEDMPAKPASPYGASKLAGEGYCSAYFHCFGLETVVLRFGNVYGERSDHKSSVVAHFIKSALANQGLTINSDGLQKRDFIHVSDIVSSICAAVRVPGLGGEVFQIAGARGTSIQELVDELSVVLTEEGIAQPEVRYGKPRQGDIRETYVDLSKARRLLAWEPGVDLRTGLRRTVLYYKERMLAQGRGAGP